MKLIILELLFREILNPQFVGRIKYKRIVVWPMEFPLMYP